MPIKWFTCPDGGRVEYKECLAAGGCRLKRRCAVRPYLRLVSTERVWTGKPSTTQLIRGTMSAFLQLTTQYAISPDDRAFMVHGTRAHQVLQDFGDDEGSILEGVLDGDDVKETGIFDLLETEGDKSILVDYKTSGSYKVAAALGMVVVDEDTGEVYKSGKRKGEPKTRKVLTQNDAAIDRRDWELQLNKYRIEIEKRGHRVDEMRVQCVVRDGNTWMARSRGVVRNLYYFDVTRLSDAEVLAYFKRKREALSKALETGHWSDPCNEHENWGGIRCTRYCEVAEHCPLGKYLRKEKELASMPIAGLSEIRRFDKLGSLRLGEKVTNASGKEYPKEIDYFKVDPVAESDEERAFLIESFEKEFGKNPKSIRVVLPVGDEDTVFPQWWMRWGKTLLQCRGDGITATCSGEEFAEGLERVGQDDHELPTVTCGGEKCPYVQNKKCSKTATLKVLLPNQPGAGVWHITTGSRTSIININSKMEHLKVSIGQCHMIWLTLTRRKKVSQRKDENGKVTTSTHWPMYLNTRIALSDVQAIGRINEPISVMATKAPLSLSLPGDADDDIPVELPDEIPEDANLDLIEPEPTNYMEFVTALAAKGEIPLQEFGKWTKVRYKNQALAFDALLPAFADDEIFEGVKGEFNKWMDKQASEPTQGTLG